jgi:hypothetical protein
MMLGVLVFIFAYVYPNRRHPLLPGLGADPA